MKSREDKSYALSIAEAVRDAVIRQEVITATEKRGL